ncbi:MAG: hypothetical protein ACOH1T_12800 [Microbacteriaceae bacterium]
MLSDTWFISPQRIDPLSWFTRSLVPVAFAGLTFVFGAISLASTWDALNHPWLDIIAVFLVTLACVTVQVRTSPLRVPFAPRHALAPMAISLIAIVLSTISTSNSSVLVQHWWLPFGIGLVLGSLAPYSSVRNIVVYGVVLTAAVGIAASLGLVGSSTAWPALSVVVIATYTPVLATVSTATFIYAVVSTTQRLHASAGSALPESERASEEAANTVERRTLARLGTRVAPFLLSVAESGVVTDSDRAVAGQLARSLRSDLVTQANRSWLDSFALYGPILVVDPDRKADHMNTAQRTALRGLLLAVLKNPSHAGGSLFLELRAQDDGSTAVALSLDINLPEGRRSMLLAPYYLALQTAVQDLSWDPSRELIKFQLPARER